MYPFMQPAIGLLRNRQVLTNSLRPAGLLSSISKNPSVNYRRFTQSSTSLMPTPLTPEIFFSPDHVKTALAKPTMMEMRGGDGGFAEVPIPESVRNTGVIPEGYRVDFMLDPQVVISALKRGKIVTVEQLPEKLFKCIKDQLNSSQNLMIVPTSISQRVYKEALELLH